MFDPATSSIGCGSLDFFETAVDFDDLAFMSMIMCMQQTDMALAAKMREIRDLNRLKMSLTDKIAKLNDAITQSGAKQDGDTVNLAGSLENPQGYAPPGPKPEILPLDHRQDANRRMSGDDEKETLRPINDDPYGDGASGETKVEDGSGDKTIYENDGDGDGAASEEGTETEETQTEGTEDDGVHSGRFTKAAVDAQIEKLRDQLDGLNSSSEVMMIDLQRLMNKRSQAVQLVSNIESRSHKTAMAIISNFS